MFCCSALTVYPKISWTNPEYFLTLRCSHCMQGFSETIVSNITFVSFSLSSHVFPMTSCDGECLNCYRCYGGLLWTMFYLLWMLQLTPASQPQPCTCALGGFLAQDNLLLCHCLAIIGKSCNLAKKGSHFFLHHLLYLCLLLQLCNVCLVKACQEQKATSAFSVVSNVGRAVK